jgi:hypothetical protein
MADPRRGHRGAAALLSALALALAGCGGGGVEERRGFLVDAGDAVRLCDALAESYPPQCAGESLLVEGDLPKVDWSETEGVRWTDGQVTLRGKVSDGILRVGR